MSKHRYLTLLFLMLILFQHMLFATINLTDEEQSYIANRGPVRAVSVDGSGPIQYTDAQGRIRGIAVQILQEIGKRTGLSFEYLLYKEIGDVHAAYSDGTDILFGIPDQYIRPEYTVSKPLLHSQTILYANKNIEPHNLKNKRFAATVSSALPEGITEGQAIYYQSREEAIKAVDKGKRTLAMAMPIRLPSTPFSMDFAIYIRCRREKKRDCTGYSSSKTTHF